MRFMLIALLFWLAETAYFGFNAHPSCPAEVSCDKVVVMVWCFGMGMEYQKRNGAK